MFVLAEKPQSVFKVTRGGLKLFFTSLPKVWYWLILFMLPSAAFSLSGRFLHDPNQLVVLTLFMLAGLVASLIMVFGYCFIMNHMNDIAFSGEARILHSARVAARKMWPVLIGSLLSSLGLSIILIGILALSVIDQIAVIIYIITGIVGVFLILGLFFLAPFILFDNLSIVKAVKSSFQLVWGNRWRILVVLLLSLLIVVGSLLLLFGVVYLLLHVFHAQPHHFTWFNIAVGFVLNLIVTLYFMAVILVQFYDLKMRKRSVFIS
jgi:hypothetical protein